MTKTVLIVDDNDLFVRLCQAVSGRLGCATAAVKTGKDALDHVNRSKPDIVVLDMNLPDMSGRDVLKTLKADPAAAAIPVIIVTTQAQAADRAELAAQGAADFLAKPIDVGTFTTALKGQLGL